MRGCLAQGNSVIENIRKSERMRADSTDSIENSKFFIRFRLYEDYLES